jgi:hypothetical protein
MVNFKVKWLFFTSNIVSLLVALYSILYIAPSVGNLHATRFNNKKLRIYHERFIRFPTVQSRLPVITRATGGRITEKVGNVEIKWKCSRNTRVVD